MEQKVNKITKKKTVKNVLFAILSYQIQLCYLVDISVYVPNVLKLSECKLVSVLFAVLLSKLLSHSRLKDYLAIK